MFHVTFSRRHLLASVAAGFSGCTSRQTKTGCDALAGQSIRWIVPYPPGGSYDNFSRLFEAPFERALGAEIIIANEAGGGALVGATKLRDARPDGRTVGILNAPGLLAASISAGPSFPNPARDFSIVGRLGRGRAVVATGANSPLRTVEDLISRSQTKPLVFGLTGAGSNNLVAIAGITALLGLRTTYLAGYGGSREETLAVMRGEVDLVSTSYESLQSSLASGDVRPILQVSSETISTLPAMQGVARLAGPDGWAARRAAATGRTAAQAAEDAQALDDAFGAGIVVAAPKGLPAELLACLRARFDVAAADPLFLQAAKAADRALDTGNGVEGLKAIEAAEAHLVRFAPLIREAIERIRK
jgi:tripartite-type tricarboxylate transporter receptor subunit TctC